MSFRTLTHDELPYFEEEFIQFLIVNDVSHEKWVQINQDEPQKAAELVHLFSQIVFEKSMQKVRYLEFRSCDKLLVFHCLDERMELIGFSAKSPKVDFSTPEKIQYSFLHHQAKIEWFKQSKNYSQPRKYEMFQLTQNGCLISTQEFYDLMTAITQTK